MENARFSRITTRFSFTASSACFTLSLKSTPTCNKQNKLNKHSELTIDMLYHKRDNFLRVCACLVIDDKKLRDICYEVPR